MAHRPHRASEGNWCWRHPPRCRRPPRREQPGTAARHRRSHRRHRAEHLFGPEPGHDRLPGHPHRGQHVTDPGPGRRRYRHLHPRGDRDPDKPLAHRLDPPAQHPQPAPNRARRDTRRRGDSPVTDTGRAGLQHRPDHLRGIGPAQQQRHRQQHMSRRTPPTPRPARSYRTLQPDHPPRPPETPPGQHPIRARRTRQLPSGQPGLDANRIDLYRHHQCLSHYARCPGGLRQEISRGAVHPSVPRHTDGADHQDQTRLTPPTTSAASTTKNHPVVVMPSDCQHPRRLPALGNFPPELCGEVRHTTIPRMASRYPAVQKWTEEFRRACRERGMRFVIGEGFVVEGGYVAAVRAYASHPTGIRIACGSPRSSPLNPWPLTTSCGLRSCLMSRWVPGCG